MNARPRFPYAEQETHLLVLQGWHRQGLEAAMDRLCGLSPSQGEGDEDAPYEAPEPYVLSERQEDAEYETEIEDNQRQYGGED